MHYGVIFIVVNCSTPPAVLNSIVQFGDTLYGSSADVICNEGYNFEYDFDYMPSVLNITCLSDGKWSSVPDCTGMACTKL